MKNVRKFSPSLSISLVIALAVWAIFYPGTLSVDSLSIYREARFGDITDIRSPFITVMLSLFLRAGGTIGLLTLVQSLFGFLGVRRLILAITALFSASRMRQEQVASIGILFLSTPLTPMPVYFVTFWLDTWLAILLLWVSALLLELAKESSSVIAEDNRFRVVLLVALITFTMLTRLNSPILYPVLILTLIYILWQTPISRGGLFALALCPLMFYLVFILMQYNFLGVRRAYQNRNFLALDLASMLTYDPSVCQTLSLHSCSVILEKISPEFIVGNGAIDHTMNQGLGTMEPAYIELVLYPLLPHELWLAATHYPWTYLKVKTLNFLDYLQPRPRYYFQSFIHPNGFGLYLNGRFQIIRARYVTWLHVVYTHPVLKMISFAHITWVFVDIAGIIFCFAFNRKSRLHTVLGLIMLVPLVYNLSYLIALTASDFRYMYPSALMVQVIVIGLVASLPEQVDGLEKQRT